MNKTILVMFLFFCLQSKGQVIRDSIFVSKQPRSLFLDSIVNDFKNYLFIGNYDSTSYLDEDVETNQGICKKIITALSYKAGCNFQKGLVNAFLYNLNFASKPQGFHFGVIEIIYKDSISAIRCFKRFNIKQKRTQNLEKVVRKFKLFRVNERIIVFQSITYFNRYIKKYFSSFEFSNRSFTASIIK